MIRAFGTLGRRRRDMGRVRSLQREIRWKAGAAVLLVGVAAGCSASSHKAVPQPPPTASPTTLLTTAPTTIAATTVSTTAVPHPSTTASPVGLVIAGQGSTLTPPAAPTVKPYNPNCASLLDPGFNGPCAVITSPAGTIAALSEVQQPGANDDQSPIQARDLVYRRIAVGWSLALRRVTTVNPGSGSGQSTILWQSDINRDGDPKAVFVSTAANPQFANELDVVETTGQVVMYRQLHGGFATVATGGGLQTFVPDPTAGYDEAIIKYSSGAWRITSISHISQAQAEAESSQPFTDPEGHQAQYQNQA